MSHFSNLPTNLSGPIQRRWVRVPINVRVRLRYERERKQQQCHCRSFDISEGGMGLISPYDLELAQVVDLDFSTAPLKLRAVTSVRLNCQAGA
jgi:c-di-GMP-binding flagellar brake protein YcgR